MNDVLAGRDFIRALRASGVPERSIIWKHELRNAALPVVTVLGPRHDRRHFRETVFGRAACFVLPGLGSLAVGRRPSRTIIAVAAGRHALFRFAGGGDSNLLVDLSYGWLNPRGPACHDGSSIPGSRPTFEAVQAPKALPTPAGLPGAAARASTCASWP